MKGELFLQKASMGLAQVRTKRCKVGEFNQKASTIQVQFIQVTEKEKMDHHGLSWLLLGVKRGSLRANLQQRWRF
jgi:hypothetical protein